MTEKQAALTQATRKVREHTTQLQRAAESANTIGAVDANALRLADAIEAQRHAALARLRERLA